MLNYELLKMASVSFGCGVAKNTGNRIKTLGGTNALIVTDKGIVSLGIVDKIAESLKEAGITYEVFDEVMSEPTDELCLRIADLAKDKDYDTIIGLGGGSPMDAAKAVGLITGIREMEEIKDLHDYSAIGSRSAVAAKAKRSRLLITIPTTAGTGAETTQSSVLTSAAHGMKYSFMSPASMADLCIVDPEFTIGMPAAPTIHTGLDALAHCIEGVVGITTNEYSQMIDLECIRKIWTWLPVAVSDPKNVRAREEMAWAAHNAMTAGGSANGHAIAHAIGSKYHIVHAMACMYTIPTVIRHFGEASHEAIVRLAQVINAPIYGDAEKDADSVAEKVKAFYKSFGYTTLQETLKEKGYEISCDEFAESLIDFTLDDFKSRVWNPPIHESREAVKEVCRKIYNEK